MNWLSEKRKILLPLGIFLLAFFLRVYELDKIPPGLWYDEAIHGLDSLQIYDEGKFPIFFVTEGHPQEPMYSYIIAGLFMIFGVSDYTLRLTSVLIGTLTIIFLYYILRSWYSERMAIWGTLLLAISKWHLMFSRLCFRTILTPLFCLLVFHFLYKGLKGLNSELRTLNSKLFIISGFFLGLGMYTYISFRLVPILVLLFILHEWYYNSKFKIQNSKLYFNNVLYLFLTAFIVFLPLLIDYIQNPFHLSGRTNEISVFNLAFPENIKLIFLNTLKTLGMFSIVGDPEIKHNNPGEPILPVILSIFLLVGLYQSLRNWKELKYLIPLSWFLFFLLPSIFSVGAPNTLRSLGGVPALCILMVFGMEFIYLRLKPELSSQRRLIIHTGIAVIFLYCTVQVGYQYFYKWGRNPQTAQHFNINEYLLAKRVKELSELFDFYLPDVLANQTVIKFVSRPAKLNSYQSIDDLPPMDVFPRPKIFIYLNPELFGGLDPLFAEKVIQRYHHGKPYQQLNAPGNPPWVLAVSVD